MMLLCKKIKIEVNKQDAEALEFMQAKCRGLYNWWVSRLHNGEHWNVERAKKSLRESKQYDSELRFVYGKLLAEVYFRLDKTMQAFFRRVAEGEKKPGFPRVKPRHQFFTLCYPAMYLEIQDKTIILPTGGGGNWGPKHYQNISAHLTEEPPVHFHEVAVSRDARGSYFCSFVYDDDAEQHKDETPKKQKKQKKRQTRPFRDDGLVAFDLGIKKHENETLKERNKRRIRNRLVYNDWGLSGFVQMLSYKCLRFGKELRIISERDTTKTCHVCKHKKAMPLWVRTYRCENCGLVMDRDQNSAVNIYERFLARLGPHTDDSVRCADVFTAIDDVNLREHIEKMC